MIQNKDIVFTKLKKLFGENNVNKEWDVAKNSQDAYTRALYCPRIDYAIGPFNINGEIYENNRMINEFYNKYVNLINVLKMNGNNPSNNFDLNDNPRCLLAIECENKVSRKHMLGTIINTSALGKVGIVIGANDKTYKALIKIRKYLEALDRFGKIKFSPNNVLIIRLKNFIDVLDNFNINI